MIAANLPVIVSAALLLAACVVAGAIWLSLRARRRRESDHARWTREGLAMRQRMIIERALPWYRRIPSTLRGRLDGCVRILIEEIPFEACGGLEEVTEEMRLVIATQASLLVVGRDVGEFNKVRVVLVYPSSFSSPVEEMMGEVPLVDEDERVGESWEEGAVIISWDAVLRGGFNHSDGLNVVAHEFAHQLDQVDGSTDGAPLLARASDYGSWSHVMKASYGRLREEVEKGGKSVLDEYGTESPAEFFPVATEAYFEKPHALFREDPGLFRELEKFYRIDPRIWRDDK